MSKVSKAIKKQRAVHGLSQEELANKMFVSRQTISSWENGRTQPDIEALQKLSAVFGISVEDLIYGTTQRDRDEQANKVARKSMLTVISVFASLFITVGGVLIFYNYWNAFPLGVKTAFSILPLLFGQALAVFTYKNKYQSTVWREVSASVWCVGVISTLALLDGVLSLPLIFYQYAILDAFLVLPIIFVFGSASAVTVYYCLSAIGCISRFIKDFSLLDIDYRNILLIVATFLMLSLGASFVFINRKKTEPKYKYLKFITAIFFIAVPFYYSFLGCWQLGFTAVVISILTLYIIRDCCDFKKMSDTLIPISAAIVSIATVELYNTNARPNTAFRFNRIQEIISELDWGEGLYYGLGLVVIIILCALLFKKYRNDAPRVIYTISLLLITVLILGHNLFCYKFICNIMFVVGTLIVCTQGVSLSLIGAKEVDFYKMNIGLLTVVVMIMLSISRLSASPLLSGLILVILGVCMLTVNLKISKANKEVSRKENDNE